MAQQSSTDAGGGGRSPVLRALDGAPLADGFRATLERRPPLSLAGVLSAVAGALLAIAALVAVASGDDPSPWLVVAVGAALVLVGWAVAFGVRLGGTRSAVGAGLDALVPGATVLALVGVWAGVTGLAAHVLDGDVGPSEAIVWWPALLTAVVLGALWVLPGLQGRPTLLALALLDGAWALAAFVVVRMVDDDRQSSFGAIGWPAPFSLFGNVEADDLRAGAVVLLSLGIGFLVITAVVDRLGLRGLGTSFVVAGIITAVVGSVGVTPSGDVLRVVVPLVVVVLIGAVGAVGRRKATTWLAGLALVPLLVQLVVTALGDDPSPALSAFLLALLGVLVLLAALGVLALGLDRPREPLPTAGPAATTGGLPAPEAGSGPGQGGPPTYPPPSAPSGPPTGP